MTRSPRSSQGTSTGPRTARSALVAALVAVALAIASAPLAPARGAAAPEEGPATVVSVPPDSRYAAAAAYARLMALPSVDTGARPRSTAPLYTGAEDCPPPRCIDRRVPVPPGVTITSNLVRILLPTAYDAPRNRDRRYPVVYLWNGMRNDHTSWTVKTELLTESKRWDDAIFVMPNGGKDRTAGFFSDWADGSYDWETYHMRVLVPWVDAILRTDVGARASVGASVGGMGAINYAARYPGMFRAVLSVSGAVDTTLLAGEGLLGPPAGTMRPDLKRIWGDPVLDRANWDAHNPILNLEKIRGTALFITSGTGYPGTDDGTVITGEYERKLWEGHRAFLQQLTTRGIAYRARVTIGGCHFWNYFDAGIRWAMPRVIRATQR